MQGRQRNVQKKREEGGEFSLAHKTYCVLDVSHRRSFVKSQISATIEILEVLEGLASKGKLS